MFQRKSFLRLAFKSVEESQLQMLGTMSRVEIDSNVACGSSRTSLTRSKGVFWENGLRKVEGIGWEKLRITLKARQRNSNVIWEFWSQ